MKTIEEYNTGNLIAYFESNKTFNDVEEFKKEITLNKAIIITNETNEDDAPDSGYLFFEKGILFDGKNNKISPIIGKCNTCEFLYYEGKQ